LISRLSGWNVTNVLKTLFELPSRYCTSRAEYHFSAIFYFIVILVERPVSNSDSVVSIFVLL